VRNVFNNLHESHHVERGFVGELFNPGGEVPEVREEEGVAPGVGGCNGENGRGGFDS
jgi:hypothetical protein